MVVVTKYELEVLYCAVVCSLHCLRRTQTKLKAWHAVKCQEELVAVRHA